MKRAQLNVSDEELLWNVKQNCLRAVKQIATHIPNNQPIAIVCGGPSLEGTFPILQDLVKEGVKTVALNGTHNYLLERGIRPSAMVMCDARPFNRRFVADPQEKTKYFVASQCHPSVYDALEGFDVYQVHLHLNIGEHDIVERSYPNIPWIVGGATVGLRAIHLMRVLGFYYMHIFGMDSCRINDKHHAYEQAENDYQHTEDLRVGDRTFVCDAWHLVQMEGFINMTKALGDMYKLQFHGDGAIAHLVNEIARTGKNPLEEQEHGRKCMGHI